MRLSWEDIARQTRLEFEAQARYGVGRPWRTLGVMREWVAADAVALTAPCDERGQPPAARRVVVVARPPRC
jgi:hypothetical protein